MHDTHIYTTSGAYYLAMTSVFFLNTVIVTFPASCNALATTQPPIGRYRGGKQITALTNTQKSRKITTISSHIRMSDKNDPLQMTNHDYCYDPISHHIKQTMSYHIYHQHNPYKPVACVLCLSPLTYMNSNYGHNQSVALFVVV